MLVRDKQRISVIIAISILLASLSVSLLGQQNLRWQLEEGAVGFTSPLILFTKTIATYSLGIVKRENSQFLSFSNIQSQFIKYLNLLNYSSTNKAIFARQKLLQSFQKIKLEGG